MFAQLDYDFLSEGDEFKILHFVGLYEPRPDLAPPAPGCWLPALVDVGDAAPPLELGL